MEQKPSSNISPQETPPEVIAALIETMRGIAHEKNIQATEEQLRTAALMVATNAEKAGEPLTEGEAKAPHSALMEKLQRTVEVRIGQ